MRCCAQTASVFIIKVKMHTGWNGRQPCAIPLRRRCLVPKPALAHYWSAQQEWMGKGWRSVNALGRLATIMKIRGVDVSEQPNVFGLPMCGSYAYSIFPESGRKQFEVELSLESGEGSNRFLGLSCLRHGWSYLLSYFSNPLHMDFVVLGSRNGSGQPHLVTQTAWDPGNTWSCFTSSASRLGENDPGS